LQPYLNDILAPVSQADCFSQPRPDRLLVNDGGAPLGEWTTKSVMHQPSPPTPRSASV